MGIKQLVTWDQQSLCMKNQIKHMMNSNELTDVTLVSNDQNKFNAHKLVLSAASAEFYDIFRESNSQNNTIYLRGFHHFEIEALLEFIYEGQTKIGFDKINDFLSAAKDLKIYGIENITEEPEELNIQNNLSEDSKEFNIQKNTELDKLDHGISDIKNGLKPNQMEIYDAGTSPKERHNSEEISYFKIEESQKEGEDINYVDKSKKRLFCEECSFKTYHDFYLRAHKTKYHKIKNIKCEFCLFQSSSKGALTNHKLRKHRSLCEEEIRGTDFVCEQNSCSYVASSKSSLNEHVQSIHEGVKYPCKFCHKVGSCKSNIRRHYKVKHGLGNNEIYEILS